MAKKAKALALDDFNALLRELAEVISKYTADEMKQKEWKVAFLDVRGSAVGTSRLKKFRVQLSDESIVATLDPPLETAQLLHRLWKQKEKVFSERWYGLILTVRPDGKCKTEFNYDAKCVGDPAFWDHSKET